MLDPVRAFERNFQRIENGYLYYPSRWSSGYLVTPEEYETLVSDWRKVAGLRALVVAVMAFGAATAALAYLLVALGSPFEAEYAGYAIACGLGGYLLWHSLAPNRLIRGREPHTPRRSGGEAERQMGQSLGSRTALSIAFTSFCFTGWGVVLAFERPIIGMPLAMIFAVATFYNTRIAIRSFKRNR